MSRRYEGEDEGDYVDRVTGEAIQEEVDDAAEAREIEAKRNAARITIEELALQDAYAEGARAGSIGTAAGLNPWADHHSTEYAAWERGRSAAESARTYKRRAA